MAKANMATVSEKDQISDQVVRLIKLEKELTRLDQDKADFLATYRRDKEALKSKRAKLLLDIETGQKELFDEGEVQGPLRDHLQLAAPQPAPSEDSIPEEIALPDQRIKKKHLQNQKVVKI